MIRILLLNAFILLTIISFKNEQQHSSSLVSATTLPQFKTKHEPSNEEWNGTSQKTNELQFDGVPRMRRSNGTRTNKNSNKTFKEPTTSNNKDSAETKRTKTVVYVSGPIGFVLLFVCCIIGSYCK